MTKNKFTYTQPVCDLLVVRFEENIMSVGANGLQNSTVKGGNSGNGFEGWDDLS